MKKLAITLLATAALSMPAMAASNMTQQPQGPQAQQSQDQQSQAQNPNDQQGQPNNQAAQNNKQIAPNTLSRNEVRQVQQALDKNGFQVGRVDGRWGQTTGDARFQQSKNIQTNGAARPADAIRPLVK